MINDLIKFDNLTIAIPTFNRAKYLSKLLQSIPKGLNILVSDNGAFLPEDFKASFGNVNFMQQSQVLDVINNWNKCIEAVKTEWFMLPSDDDLYFNDSFRIIKKYIAKYNDADLLIFGHLVIDKNEKEISRWVPLNENEYNSPQGFELFKYGVESRFPSMVFRTAKVRGCGNLDESFKLTAADSKMIQKVMLSGKVVFIPEIVGAYRTWSQNSTVLTLGTSGWLKEIDKWQNDIEIYIRENIKGIPLNNFKYIKDEVYANNLLGGIANIKTKSGLKEAFRFAKSVRFPWNAKLITKLRIIKALLLK